MLRPLILGIVLFVAGCGGQSTPTTAPATAPKAEGKLPPEVEFDPATATEMHKKNQKPKP
jgi:hypothetical protein